MAVFITGGVDPLVTQTPRSGIAHGSSKNQTYTAICRWIWKSKCQHGLTETQLHMYSSAEVGRYDNVRAILEYLI